MAVCVEEKLSAKPCLATVPSSIQISFSNTPSNAYSLIEFIKKKCTHHIKSSEALIDSIFNLESHLSVDNGCACTRYMYVQLQLNLKSLLYTVLSQQ